MNCQHIIFRKLQNVKSVVFIRSSSNLFQSFDQDRERCEFRQGDACNLPLDLGQFGCVLAANLICRLPDPMAFLLRLSNLVAPGGICVITSPYSFLEEYTSKVITDF